MKDFIWFGFLFYSAAKYGLANDPGLSIMKGSFKVESFAVKGGAKRLIELASTNEKSLISEFEQARSFKNLKIYLPVSEVFSLQDLNYIAENNTIVSISLMVSELRMGIFSQTLKLTSENAKIKSKPHYFGEGRGDAVFVDLEIPDSSIAYISQQLFKETVVEEW